VERLYRYLDSYVRHLVSERGASPHTVEAYNRDILTFIRYLEEMACAEPERRHVEAFIGYMREKGRSTRSVVGVSPPCGVSSITFSSTAGSR
jgi:site-specific recombinase XerC